MDFDQSQSDKNLLLNDAIYPERVREKTKNFTTLKGYIYIISKRFKAFPTDPERLLMKIGFNDFYTDDKRDKKEKERKNLSRLQGFRTTLISFKLHRLLLFDSRDTELEKGSAHEVEKQLHKMVTDKFNPPAIRITFDNETMDGVRDRPTEWFWVKNGDKGLKKMLDWIDKQLYYNTQFEPTFATRFHGNPEPNNTNAESIKPDEEYPNRPPKLTSFVVTRGTVRERNEISRTSNAVEAKRKTQRQTEQDDKKAKKLLEQRKITIREEEKKIERNAKFWKKVFVGRTFTDKNMGVRDGVKDDGKYPNYIINDVSKPRARLESTPQNIFLVHYEPDVTRQQLRKMTPEEIEFRTDYIALHEAMDLTSLADIKTKYKKEYDHFSKKYRYGNIDFELREN